LTYITIRDHLLGKLEEIEEELTLYSGKYAADHIFYKLGLKPDIPLVKLFKYY